MKVETWKTFPGKLLLDPWGSNSLSFAWVSVENLTSKSPRGTRSYDYTGPGFYKTLL